MAPPEPADGLAWQSLVAATLLVSGFALLASSFIVANTSTARAAWSQEQARQYQAASARLHGLSHEFAHAEGSARESPVRAELGRAQAEYDELLGQLENAIARPKRITMLLRIGGVVSIVAGAVSLYWSRSSQLRQAS